jgi:16S rRNA (adenine1518-N6/adenine1519-N6)-dimethyltransferase
MEKMIHPDYNSPASLKTFLETNNMAMQKKFGQNFLINENVRIALIDALQVSSGTTVWEVGPGLGAMTEELLKRKTTVTAFEIDHGFSDVLQLFFLPYIEQKTFSLIEGDVLKNWYKRYESNSIPDRFFGNLPYNIAATLIADTITSGVRFDRAVVTVQKEVGQRMSAKTDSQDYSSFSVLCQWAYTVKPLMDLAGGNFWPRPGVDSRAVLLEKKSDFPCCNNPEHFVKMIRSIFSSRRKTIKNTLALFTDNPDIAIQALEHIEIQMNARADTLELKKLLALSDEIDRLK